MDKISNISITKVYIIIVHYFGIGETLKLIDSLKEQDYQNFQIILVNNNPKENLREHIIDFVERKRWKLIREKFENENSFIYEISQFKFPIVLINQENLGYAGGVNTGLRYALNKDDFSYIWILNNDLILDPSSLMELVNYAEIKKKEGVKVGIIGSKLLYYWNPKVLQGVGGKYNKYFALTKHIGGFEEDKGQYDKEIEGIDYIIGASMFITKEFLLDVGLMDESYFLYFEDLDWSERAKRKGYKLVYCWKSKVYHKEGESIGSSSKGGEKSELADYYGVRNKISFTKKFYPQYLPLVYLSLIGVLINRIRRKQFKRINLILRAILEKSS